MDVQLQVRRRTACVLLFLTHMHTITKRNRMAVLVASGSAPDLLLLLLFFLIFILNKLKFLFILHFLLFQCLQHRGTTACQSRACGT